VVEGGTLLRCYTSQRGIEGSNPSSSASRAAHLQHKREAQDKGRNSFRPLLHQQVHQRSQNALIRGPESYIRNVNMYPRPPDVVVAFAAHPGLARPKRVSMAPKCRILDATFREFFHALG
jgi:hypothetical protein